MKNFLRDDRLERVSTSASAVTQAEQRWLSDAQRDSSSPYFVTSENVRAGRRRFMLGAASAGVFGGLHRSSEAAPPPGAVERDVPADPKKAPIKTVESYWPYATTLFDYIKRAMPFNTPDSLTNDQVYAASAYILARANIIPAGSVVDAKSLAQVRMPNRDGFIPDRRPEKFPPVAASKAP